MFKKLLLVSAILAATSTLAHASGPCTAAPYLGIGFGEQTNTDKISNFRGVPVTIFGGYGADMGQGIYLAGEIAFTPATAPINNNGLRSTYSYGINFIPGILISDHTMTYAKVGVLRTNFSPSGVNSKVVTGGTLGLGIQTSLTQNWDLRGEYSFVVNKTLGGGHSTPRSDIAMLDLVYRFGY